MSNRQTPLTLLPTLLTLAIAASMPAMAQQDATASETGSPTGAAGAEVLTDGQVLQIVRTLNDGEIAQAELALDKTDDAQVQAVAEMIKAEHEMSNEDIERLEDENDEIDLDDSATSESLAAMAEETREGLEELDDAAFACAYLMKQVEGHEMALDTVSTKLVPAASNAQVQAFLTASTPKLEHHLEMAKMAQEGLAACGE